MLGSMLLAVIAACEIGFWVVLAAGLAARYLLRMRRLSTVLLVCVPLVDVVLFVASVLDLARGTTANVTHGLAAAYIGFSVAYGHSMIRWADQRFAHRFAGGPPPWRPPKESWARARYEWREWGKGVLGWAVASVMLLGAIVWIDDAARTQELAAWIGRLSLALTVWLVGWPVWATVSAALTTGNAQRSG
jgi:hypothetical protein